MILSTLCYIEKDNQWLMLHRNKKSIDPNGGKYNGVSSKTTIRIIIVIK